MKERPYVGRKNRIVILSFTLPFLLFWTILYFRVSPIFSSFFQSYSTGLFLITLVLYYLSFRLPNRFVVLACLGLTMVFLALPLSYKWTSGFSDNFLIGGLLPYKDAKSYYLGANLILDGLPLIKANQATERPLYPGFLSSVLFLTGGNLKITLAFIIQLAGLGIYLSARQIHRLFGPLGAGLFATLLYFYIQPWVGYAMSEILGFTMGCLGFVVLLSTIKSPSRWNLLLASLLLMVGVSARAGTFFIFPMLALWIGWIFRGEKRYSITTVAYVFGLMFIGYFLLNSIYSRLLGIPPGSSFGNFSYAMYGQARGGTGWHSAVAELGTRDPAIVWRATWEYFLTHPISLFIGFAKSYRDFFLIGDGGIFPFGNFGAQNIQGVLLWLGTIFLLVWGLIQLIRDIHSNHSLLLIAGFIGIFLSIPFLPPVDGGARFYAGTVPFFFVLPAVGIEWFSSKAQQTATPVWMTDLGITKAVSIAVIIMTLIIPFIIHTVESFKENPDHIVLQCSAGQESFVIELHPDSYIDLVKNGTAKCGDVPNVCFDDFKWNNIEKTTDDFYQELFRLTDNTGSNARIIPAVDQIENEFHYFYLPLDKLSSDVSYDQLSGCATDIRTTYQSIFKVESILSELK